MADVKVSELITFTDKVDDELEEETTARKKMLEYYKSEEGKKVVQKANDMFNYLNGHALKNGGLLPVQVDVACQGKDYEHFKIFQMSRDRENGDKLRHVSRVVDGKPVFTDDLAEANRVGGTYFHPDGVMVRLVSYRVDGVPTKVARVELPSIHFPTDMSQFWVYVNIKGHSTMGFRVDGTQICPLEGLPQYGVSAADRPAFNPTSCDIKVRD